jgi:hypothetical protein
VMGPPSGERARRAAASFIGLLDRG